MDLDQVVDQVRADDDGKRDLLLDRDELLLRHGRVHFPQAAELYYPDGLAPSGWAVTQLCQRLNMPASYFKRCPEPLQDDQFNHWIEHGERPKTRPERWLLRTRRENLRGVLTERYACLDNRDVLDTLRPLVEPQYQVGWFALSDESFHLRLIDPRLGREVLPHDRLVAGVHLANSEVGKRAVTVDAMVYRLVCSNGLVRLVSGGSLLYQRHVSWSKPRFEVALHQAVQAALVHGVGFIERMSWATQVPVPDMDTAIGTLGGRWSLSQTTTANVRQSLLGMPRDQQETLYGLVNAVTHAAQSLPADERYGLETLAGDLVEHGLPPLTARLKPSPEGVLPL